MTSKKKYTRYFSDGEFEFEKKRFCKTLYRQHSIFEVLILQFGSETWAELQYDWRKRDVAWKMQRSGDILRSW